MAAASTIKVGLITDGPPRFRAGNLHGLPGVFVSNLLIGEGFHWQQTREVFMPGSLRLLDNPQGNIRAVNEVPVEDYVLSVISSEMSPDAPLEFLKAHAVISRSWAMGKVLVKEKNHAEVSHCKFVSTDGGSYIGWEEADSHHGFDVCSDDHCQRYQGLPPNIPGNVRMAIDATAGKVLLDHDHALVDARFSKCCGGRTEIFSSCWADKDFDYLISQDDPWCDLSGMPADARDIFLKMVLKDYDRPTETFYNWSLDVSKKEIEQRLRSRFSVEIGEIEKMTVLQRGLSGRATLLRLEGSIGAFELGKELPIRRLLAANCLYSSWFDVADCGSHFQLNGHGWGHGVGLCQIGAARMAIEGCSHEEILSFYYPNTTIGRIS